LNYRPTLLGWLLLALFVTAWCPPTALADPPIPPLTGRVVDNAGILSGAEERSIERLLVSTEQLTGAQIVVATLPALGRYPIETWGLALGRGWKIGRAGHDDGIVIVLAPNDREVRIEIGYGLEKRVSNATADRIIKAHMLPAARQGRYADGLEAVIDALRQVILDPEAPVASKERGVEVGKVGVMFLLGGLVACVIISMLLTSGFRRRAGSDDHVVNDDVDARENRDEPFWTTNRDRRDRHDWRSSSGSRSFSFGGGSSFRGGGGSFRGGGASGKW
jgi:uncharacterized protein